MEKKKVDNLVCSQRSLLIEGCEVMGHTHRWRGGQYCSITTAAGVVGCGIFDLGVADEFGMAFALAKGTPERPLVEPEDLLEARIVKVSAAAREMGIREGMSGREAVGWMLREAARREAEEG